MDEDKRAPEEEVPVSAEAPATPPRRRERTSANRRQRSAYVYLIALVAVAFLLLLFAYLMQQRNSQEIMGNLSDLRESMTSIQSVDDLLKENRSLLEENRALKEQLGEAQGQLVDAQGNLSQEELRSQALEEQRDALLLLEELEFLCQSEQYEAALALEGRDSRLPELLAEVDAGREYLPEQPTLTERWQAVSEVLTRSGDEE